MSEQWRCEVCGQGYPCICRIEAAEHRAASPAVVPPAEPSEDTGKARSWLYAAVQGALWADPPEVARAREGKIIEAADAFAAAVRAEERRQWEAASEWATSVELAAALRAASPAAVPPEAARNAELARLARELADADLGPAIRADALAHAVDRLTETDGWVYIENDYGTLTRVRPRFLLRALAGEAP